MPDRVDGISHPTGNALLNALSARELSLLRPSLSLMERPQGFVMIRSHEAIKTVFFPVQGMVSLFCVLANGDAVEVGVVGREGAVGLPALMSASMGAMTAIVQLPASGYGVNTRALLRFVALVPSFGQVLARAGQALFVQAAQSAACNRRHLLISRLAKWLLMADDRSSGHALDLTHEHLASSLGVRRAGVTEAISALKSSGALHGANGRITILDRPQLERSACECYRVIRRLTAQTPD